MIVEVLSPNNRQDTWRDVWAYLTIPGLREVLLLDVVRMRGQILRRCAGGSWPERAEPIEAEDVLVLESIGFRVPLAAIYARTHLGAG